MALGSLTFRPFDLLGLRRKWGNRPCMAAVEGMNGGGGGGGPERPPFLRDLSAQARKLPKIIGRNKEMTDMIQKLLARGKNSFVVTGRAGVGKTTVARGLAKLDAFNGRKFVELDLPGLLAESGGNPGKFGRALQEMRDWLKETGAVLIIDEICSINQIPVFGELFWNTLKTALAEDKEGEKITIIGTTTPEQYVKHIENDEGGMARRLPKIEIKEPNPEETFQFLTSIKTRWEKEAGIGISHVALRKLVLLAHKYMKTEAFPDKAITVMDETAARIKDESSRRVRELEDLAARLTIRINNAIAVRQSQDKESRQLTDHSVREILAEYERICAVCEQLIPAEITPEIIEESISLKTGIPLSRLTENEAERILQMEAILGKRVIGQVSAKKVLASAVRRGRQGLRDFGRPAGVFMFLGPTGVGKTELARELARFLFFSEENLVRIDMSEFQLEHTVTKLTGAPPSYVGYGDPGKFEAVRRKNYTVLLLDEMEKAHPKVFDVLLQILDYGKCTDGQGREIDFTNSYIIFTSNLGAGRPPAEVREILKQGFRPEFLGRIGEENQIIFEGLTHPDMRAMVDIHTRDVIKQVYDKGYFLEITENAKDVIAKAGYQPEYGARPLKRAVDALVGKPLSDIFPTNQFSDGQKLAVGDTIRVEVREGALVFVKGDPGKFQPPQLNLSAPMEEVWQKLNSRIDEGRDFALEELYPLMSRLPKAEEQREAKPAPEAPPAPVPVEVKPEPPAAVEPPPAERAPVEPPSSMRTGDLYAELYLGRRRPQRLSGPSAPPPVPSRPVEAKPTALWGRNQERLAEAVRTWLRSIGKKEFPKGTIDGYKLAKQLGIDDQNSYGFRPELEQLLNSLRFFIGSAEDFKFRYDEELFNKIQARLSFEKVKEFRLVLQNAVKEMEERMEMGEKLRIFGAVGTNEDIFSLSELAEYYREKSDWEMQRAVLRAVINVARRTGNRETLTKLLAFTEAIDALVGLATPADMPLIDDMLKSRSVEARVAALRLLKKIGSRGDLPRIIKRLKGDQEVGVKQTAAETFAQFAEREDLPMIRDMAKSGDRYLMEAAGAAFSRIATREDLEELKKYCSDDKTRDYFKAGLVKIITREDLNFEAIKDYMERRKGTWSSIIPGDEITKAVLEAFPRLATPEDMSFIQELLKSKNKDCNLAGFRAYCKLLTEFDVSELLRYLVDYDTRGERNEATEINRAVAAIAAETYGRLATEDDLPEIKTMLNSRTKAQRRAVAWALSKPSVAQKIPLGLKELLREIAEKGEDVGDTLAQALLSSMLSAGWTTRAVQTS